MYDESMLAERKEGKERNLTRSWHKCHSFTNLVYCGMKKQYSKTSRNMREINEDNQVVTLFYESVWNWYLSSVCTNEASCTETNVFAFFSHLGKKIKIHINKWIQSCVLPHHIYTTLTAVVQFLDFCSFCWSRSVFSTYTDCGSK
jgi:hypothetical protein